METILIIIFYEVGKWIFRKLFDKFVNYENNR
jgi:hypothetical protein